MTAENVTCQIYSQVIIHSWIFYPRFFRKQFFGPVWWHIFLLIFCLFCFSFCLRQLINLFMLDVLVLRRLGYMSFLLWKKLEHSLCENVTVVIPFTVFFWNKLDVYPLAPCVPRIWWCHYIDFFSGFIFLLICPHWKLCTFTGYAQRHWISVV